MSSLPLGWNLFKLPDGRYLAQNRVQATHPCFDEQEAIEAAHARYQAQWNAAPVKTISFECTCGCGDTIVICEPDAQDNVDLFFVDIDDQRVSTTMSVEELVNMMNEFYEGDRMASIEFENDAGLASIELSEDNIKAVEQFLETNRKTTHAAR